MADKMMRIAGRDSKGVAKAIKTDSTGTVETKITSNNIEDSNFSLRKLLEHQSFKRNDIYSYGVGFNKFVLDAERSFGTHAFASNQVLDYLSLTMLNNVNNTARCAIVSNDPISTSGNKQDKVIVEYELTTDNNRSVTVFLHYRNAKSFAARTSGITLTRAMRGSGKRRFLEFDVSDRNQNDNWYLEISIEDTSSASPSNAEMRVYNVYTLREKTVTTSSSLSVKDKLGNNVDLTAEKDLDGKAVLRVFDAAPHNQDAFTDSTKTLAQTKVKYEEVYSGTIAPNGEATFPIKFENESKIWFHVETSQPNWRMFSGTLRHMDGGKYRTFFPEIHNEQTTAHPSTMPRIARWLGVSIGSPTTSLPTQVQTLTDAEMWSLPPGNATIQFYVENRSSTTANNIIVRIVRIWG
ncbi:hypothetical protein M3936_03655 [Sutcliffiella horikoshii]|uniref:hypothetical protein n=1 Tax=Sutcliffiella horikoshii TaxID=79883 RepID=UPI00203CD3D7|nr:hypothetical protein [Sutcliffiella horikoshii]MCM3616672.1 hypothetical protein [Sutcliffiella horikoshii]